MADNPNDPRHPRYIPPDGQLHVPTQPPENAGLLDPEDIDVYAVDPPVNLSDLFTALAEAQQEITNAEATDENDYLNSKYANLAAVMTCIREPLAKQGLAIIQYPVKSLEPGVLTLETMLTHSSGQFISSRMEMTPEKTTPQGIGSCLTYMRRYSISALIGVAQYDDDAHASQKGSQEYDRITPAETDEILKLADELFPQDSDPAADFVVNRMLAKVFSTSDVIIEKVSDIPAGQAEQARKLLENTAKRESDKATPDASGGPQEEDGKADEKKPPKPRSKKPAAREPGSDDE